MRKTSRNLWIFCFLIAFWIFDCEALCGFNRTASPDVAILNTPGYPRNYNSSQDCQWTLEATSGYQVQFTVHSGESEACCDYLEVFDGPSIYSPSLERVKGTVLFSRCFTSTTRHLTVRFVSDDSIERRGFNGSYNLNRIECVARSDPANSISRPSKSLWFVNDNVTYSCQDGYQLLGSATSRCDNNGEWTNDLPVCAALPESRFHLTDVELNFDQSRQHCRSLGGDLAIIQNQQEQDYLSAKAKRLYPGGVTFYIGLKRVGSAWIFNRGHLQWINGKRVSDGFQSWNTGEPNYGGANENCVIMYIAEETFWNDIACGRRFFAACETVYDPCINNPCLNGGNCFKRKNTFSCECPVYVDGDRCENVIQCPAPVLHPSLNTVPSRNADSYRVGTRFNLTCDIGKVFVGNPKNIECQRNGAWSETSGVCSTCASRNLTAAQAVNHRCGEMCQEDSGRCRRGKICKCDHECGYSCISRRNTCGHPPLINHTQSTQVKRNRNGKISLVPYPPYQYDDFVEYVCGPGFELSQFKPTICQSRRRWTRGRTFCIRTCEDNNINDTARNVLSCRDRCIFEKDCNHGEQCLCDGNCGRSCVNPDIDCGEAPTSSNAAINYAGQGFYRVAHYSCAEGFYLVSGSPRRKCTGRGIYDGNLPECARVKCSDPFVAFQATGGVVPQNRTDNYSVDAQVKFRCPSTHRLLGPTSRTCLTDGRWSGQDSACDVIDATTRCPHPGVPINGRLVTNGNFSVGSVIQFRCDPGYVMLGEHEQECMYFLQWSNLGAPQCIDTDISNINVRAIDQVQNSLEELRDSPRTTRGVGGRIRVTFAYENVEIYLVVDISSSKGENCFHQSLDILTKILSEMYGSENTNFRISLIAYATRADAVHQPEPGDSVFSKEDILQKLKDLIDDKDKLRKKLGSSSNLNKALHLLITLTKLSPKTKKLIYITSCGIEHRDEFDENTVLEQNSVNQFKAHFKKQISEIFVILVCLKCKSTLENSDNVLLSIASSYDHAFVVKDSSQYIDPLRGVAQPETDKTEAGKSCGKAGDTTMVKKRALQLFARNKEPKNGAWPWHAVITTKVVIRRKIKDKIHGGGSLIDNRWVLTAAHLFAECNFSDPNWHLDFRVILGAHRLNMAKKMFQSNAKTFEPEKIILHENYKIDLSEGILPDLDFDVAVIKLGREYDLRGNDKFFASARSGSLNYTSLIRPVCLPCMENNCVKGWADSQKKMTSNRSETQSTEDSCAVEENMFMTHKHSVTVIIGFGKTANEETSQHLLQGRVKIKSRNECSTVLPQMRHANNEAAKPLKRNFTYTNRMLCALGEYGGYVTDAGPGDSGGALTREIYDEATKTSCWIQLGIVSWGYDNDNLFSTNGTRRNFPGYYTNVFSVLNWIKDKVHPPQDATCEAPEEIPHGSINGNMTYNQTITYSCDEGYFLKGNRTRRCRSDRKWSGSQPTCHAFCSVPKPQRNGYANNFQDTLLPGSVVNYVCKLGYVMSGSPLVRCQEGGNWSELRFSCSKKRCPEPLVPDNGYKEGNDYTFGNRVYFFCNEGYTLLERQNYRKCSANGEWSGQLPTCEVVICPVPVAPNQGSVDTILTEYPYNTRVHYSCQRDFKIVGSAIGVCDENGSWSDAPSCEVDNDCNFDNFNRPFCRYENIRSRWRRVSSANVPFGSRGFVARLDSESLSLPANEVATLRSPSVDSDQGLCLKFYYLLRTLRHGEDFVVMISSSSNAKREIWRSNSKERKNSWLNADIRIDPSLRNVSVEFVARKSRTRFPTSLDLDEISLSSSDQCENECEGVACHNGGTCRNRINSFECLCRSGYRGTNCETRISCQILNIPNTAYQPVQTTYYFGDRITYSCNRGFRQMVPGDLTCGQSGQWTRDGQVLTESRHPSCSPIRETSFQFITELGNKNHHQDICRRRGGNLAIIRNEEEQLFLANKARELYPGRRVEFYIGMKRVGRSRGSKGYFIWRDNTRVDAGYDAWNHGEPNDSGGEDCGTLVLSTSTAGWNDIGCWRKRYSICETPIPETSFQIITELGNKNHHQEVCRRRGGNLAIIRNEEEKLFLVNKARELYPGENAEFYIGMERVGRSRGSKGYFIWRDNTRVDAGYDAWNHGEPNDSGGEDCGTLYLSTSTAGWKDIGCWRKRYSICETPLPCSPPNLDATVQTLEPQTAKNRYPVGTKLTLTCGSRRVLVGGTKIIACQESGRWNSTAGTCQTFCPPPVVTAPVQLHRQTQLVGPFLVGHVVQFQCANLNHNPVGAQSIRCLNTGSWSDPPPNTCVDPDAIPRECPRLIQPANGTMQRVGNIELYRIGSVARFSCNDGYRRDGQSHLVCEPSYTWSDSVPTCQMKGCVISRPPTSLTVNFIPSKEYPVGHRLEALCSMNRSRQITLTCLGRNQWNPQINSELC